MTKRIKKLKLLWIAVKLLDKSVNRVTLLEMMKHLEKNFDIYFLTGWRDKPLDIQICGRALAYFPQYGRGLIQRLTRYICMNIAVKKYIYRVKPDVVLINCINRPSVVRTVLNCSKKVGAQPILDIRTLPTSHQTHPDWRAFAKILSFAAKYFKAVTYITDEMRRYCIQRYNLPSHNSEIWTSGVDPDLFQPVFSRSEDNYEEKPFRLIYHGGIINAARGLDCLIRSIALVSDLNVTLTLISSLREENTIKLIDKLGLHKQIKLMDTIPHNMVPEQIQMCDVGVLPFPNRDVWNTSSPIKLFEYLACGKPVIVTDIPAHRNVLKGKSFAFFASTSSPEDLADAIRRAYASRTKFLELGRAARKHVLNHYTWQQQAKRLAVFLKKILY